MHYSLNWLKNYVSLEVPVSAVQEAITRLGFEVEGVHTHGLEPLAHVVVGEVVSRDPHPAADRLSVCTVRVSPTEAPLQIVCGAHNYKVGDRVPTALEGAVLPGNFKIKRSKLRGVESQGMMCSAREIGLGSDAEGLLILSPQAPLGAPIHTLFPAPDTVLDVEITPNRPDVLSHLGLARELAAYFQQSLNRPAVAPLHACSQVPWAGPPITVVGSGCTHYQALLVEGLEVGPSPEWLKTCLEAVGMRSINNVVDVTNFVMLETGQPLHAFDADCIRGGIVQVRTAQAGEAFQALDKQQYPLTPSMLVVADAQGPLALAGIIGGREAEVGPSTQTVLLEAAVFQPEGVRTTARALGIQTESAYRFQRSVDPEGLEYALGRAAELLGQCAGGRIRPGCFQLKPPVSQPHVIALDLAYLQRFCGFAIPAPQVEDALKRLGLGVKPQGPEGWTVEVPSFRPDLKRPVDLVEEVVRVYGCNRILSKPSVLRVEQDAQYYFESRMRAYFSAHRFHECLNYTFLSQSTVEACFGVPAASVLQLENPISAEYSHLRPNLLPGLLEAFAWNQDKGNAPERLFEVGRVFKPTTQGFSEQLSLGFVLAKSPVLKGNRENGADYFDAKAYLLQAVAHLGLSGETLLYKPVPSEGLFWEGQSVALLLPDWGLYGEVGLLKPEITARWGVKSLLLAGSIQAGAQIKWPQKEWQQFHPLSPFPPVTKDIALVVDDSLPLHSVQQRLRELVQICLPKACEVESLWPFDVYQGEGVGEGKKSLGFAITLRPNGGTLAPEVVQSFFDQLLRQVIHETPYKVRGV